MQAEYDSIYKFWYRRKSRARWQAAAEETHKGRLADWIRDTLDDQAKRDLSLQDE